MAKLLLTLDLDKVTEKEIPKVGGKAASIIKLIDAKQNVPEGFVVMSQADLEKNKEHILEKFDSLNSKYVSVRSSVSIHTDDDSSIYGQFDTYLNVEKKELIDMIAACRKSKNNHKVINYCHDKDLNLEDIEVAVIVQEMIQCEISGVAFSINPITRDTTEIMIKSVYGLGSIIGSGKVIADTYLVDKESMKISQKIVQNQRVKAVLEDKEGSIIVKVDENLADNQKLPDTMINDVAKSVVAIEKSYNNTVEVEWGYENGEFFVLQSKPILGI